jgi:hypothetical protein
LPGLRRLLMPAARSLGRDQEAAMQTAIDQALEVLVRRLETRNGIETLVIGGSLRQAAGEVHRIRTLLDGLLRNRLRDDWPARLVQMKSRLDVSCRLRFAIALEVEFADALQALGADSQQVVMNRLEDVAVHLRNLEQEALQIESSETYGSLLREAAEHIKAAALAGALGLVDSVRLVESWLDRTKRWRCWTRRTRWRRRGLAEGGRGRRGRGGPGGTKDRALKTNLCGHAAG